jgi:hypothetical protein
MLRNAVRLLGKWPLKVAEEVLFPDHWRINWQYNRSPIKVNNHYTSIPSPTDGFIADPCAVEWEDKTLVFCEHWIRKKARGQIDMFEVARDGAVSDPVCVLKEDWHLSYPFVFNWEGRWWMLPESSSKGQLNLYVAERFPTEWTCQETFLENVNGCDATLANIDGYWWMWVSTAPWYLDCWDEVRLFMSEKPVGPWIEHPMSPVVSNATCSRPAGRVFFYQGHWIRPAQDCSRGYGVGIRFQKITLLDQKSYAEETIGDAYPNSASEHMGIHTWSIIGDKVFFDSKRKVSRFKWKK